MYIMGHEEIEAVRKVIESERLFRYQQGTAGFADRFEQALARKIGVKHAIAVSSGTGGLICAMVGLGLGPGDEVIVPAYTFMSSALAPLAAGAVPIIADIDESLTIDPKDIEAKITPHTRAIMPVHMRGLPCDMTAIMRIARKHNLLVCEDACQAVGGSYKGKRLGSIGQANVFSFNFYKNMTCGEGGAVLANDPEIYDRALIYHDGGCVFRKHAEKVGSPFFAGLNFRISELQGAIMTVQLKRLDGILKKLRARKAAMLNILAGAGAFRLSPINDVQGDCGTNVALLFPTADEAEAFGTEHKLGRPINSGRHVYTNWEPILSQRSHHPKMNPYKLAKRKIKYSKDMCHRTLNILARTVMVGVPFHQSLAQVRQTARKLL